MSKHSLIKLRNGLTLVLQRISRVSSVSVFIGIRAGSYYETKKNSRFGAFFGASVI